MPYSKKNNNNNSTDSAFFSTEDPEAVAERELNGDAPAGKIFNGSLSVDRSRSTSGDSPSIFTSKYAVPGSRAKARTVSESASNQQSIVTVPRGQKNSRKSRACRGVGGAKKEGAGGNFTWGKRTANYGDAKGVLDVNDPNYDSEGDEDGDFFRFQKLPTQMGPEKALPHITNMLNHSIENGDVKDNIVDMLEHNLNDQAKVELVRVVTNKLFDQKANGREICSEVIAESISLGLIEEIDFKLGLEKFLFTNFKDVLVDYPDAQTILKKYLIRATADHAINLAQLECMMTDQKIVNDPQFLAGFEGAHSALTTSTKALYHVNTIWGITGIRPTNQLTSAIEDIVDEFTKGSASADEIAQELRELEVPHFNHEIARVVVMAAIESMNKHKIETYAKLIYDLEKKGILTDDAIKGGFGKIYRELPDIKKDLPPAQLLLQALLNQLSSMQVVDVEFARNSCPRDPKSRMRTLSENPEDGRYNIEWNDTGVDA